MSRGGVENKFLVSSRGLRNGVWAVVVVKGGGGWAER